MPTRHTPVRGLRLWLAVLPGLLFAGLAWAQADPPGRVARLNHLEGRASFALENSGTWTPAEFNHPLTSGDQIAVEPGSRAELHSGSTALRLDGDSWLIIDTLDDTLTRLQLAEGALALRIRTLFEGERYEVGSANLSFVPSEPGDYRLDVDPARGVTRVTVQRGSGVVSGGNAGARTLVAPQQIVFDERQGAFVQTLADAPRDNFDLWVSVRNHREDEAVSARYVSREIVGYPQLDFWGIWITDPYYGPVWMPRVTIVDWAPYRYGRWRWIAPWGWTWVDDAPWGFAPFHYGRWIQINLRWVWVPGPVAPRPVYAPALVGFIGIAGSSGDLSWSLSISTGGLGVGIAWFPLAPGELWRPPYPASSRYLEPINRWPAYRDAPRPPAAYRYQRDPGALTIVPADEFGQRHRYLNRNYSSLRPDLPERELSRTQVLPPPPRSVGPREERSTARPLAPVQPAPRVAPPDGRQPMPRSPDSRAPGPGAPVYRAVPQEPAQESVRERSRELRPESGERRVQPPAPAAPRPQQPRIEPRPDARQPELPQNRTRAEPGGSRATEPRRPANGAPAQREENRGNNRLLDRP